jgi:myosin heavy subunit
LGLDPNPSSYKFLQTSSVLPADASNFKETLDCLQTLGMGKEDVDSIFQVLSGILHLGNINFIVEPPKTSVEMATSDNTLTDEKERNGTKGMEKATVEPGIAWDALKKSARALRVKETDLRKSLTQRSIWDPATKSFISVPLSPEQSASTRDAFAKSLYDRLFCWLVRQINLHINAKKDESRRRNVIGVLDVSIKPA